MASVAAITAGSQYRLLDFSDVFSRRGSYKLGGITMCALELIIYRSIRFDWEYILE